MRRRDYKFTLVPSKPLELYYQICHCPPKPCGDVSNFCHCPPPKPKTLWGCHQFLPLSTSKNPKPCGDVSNFCHCPPKTCGDVTKFCHCHSKPCGDVSNFYHCPPPKTQNPVGMSLTFAIVHPPKPKKTPKKTPKMKTGKSLFREIS